MSNGGGGGGVRMRMPVVSPVGIVPCSRKLGHVWMLVSDTLAHTSRRIASHRAGSLYGRSLVDDEATGPWYPCSCHLL